uniref:Uncharacterized protein n=1 Tax=viral metagenome TaxID=1070528 RepID=A0A6H1ZBA9_9ZZZZ
MITIKRIAIEGGSSTCCDKAYHFVSKVLKRRYGNSVTFAFDWEVAAIIKKFKEAGFIAKDDNYSIKVFEPEDYKVGNTILADSFLGFVPLVIKEIFTSDEGNLTANVKYARYPRKRSINIYIKTKEEMEREILKYGKGMLEEYKQESSKRLELVK